MTAALVYFPQELAAGAMSRSAARFRRREAFHDLRPPLVETFAVMRSFLTWMAPNVRDIYFPMDHATSPRRIGHLKVVCADKSFLFAERAPSRMAVHAEVTADVQRVVRGLHACICSSLAPSTKPGTTALSGYRPHLHEFPTPECTLNCF